MRDTTLDEAFESVAELNGTPPDPQVWEVAIEKSLVSDFLDGDLSIDELVLWIDEFSDSLEKLNLVREDRIGSSSRKKPENHRRWAIREIFAFEADELDAVKAFRTRRIPNGLLESHQLAEWVSTQEELDGPPSTWITTLANDDGSPLSGGAEEPGYIESPRTLRIAIPDQQWARVVFLNAFGTLYELAEIADTLIRRYDWSEPIAAAFVLTGQPPPVSIARYTEHRTWPWYRARRYLTISVPLDVTPPEVMALYRRERNRILADDPARRAIGRHTAELAIFAAKHSTGHTWPEVMELWNADSPDSTFEHVSRFTRDSRSAFKRVMGESLKWSGATKEDNRGTS